MYFFFFKWSSCTLPTHHNNPQSPVIPAAAWRLHVKPLHKGQPMQFEYLWLNVAPVPDPDCRSAPLRNDIPPPSPYTPPPTPYSHAACLDCHGFLTVEGRPPLFCLTIYVISRPFLLGGDSPCSCFTLFPSICVSFSHRAEVLPQNCTSWAFILPFFSLAPPPSAFIISQLLTFFSHIALSATHWTVPAQSGLLVKTSGEPHHTDLPLMKRD